MLTRKAEIYSRTYGLYQKVKRRPQQSLPEDLNLYQTSLLLKNLKDFTDTHSQEIQIYDLPACFEIPL